MAVAVSIGRHCNCPRTTATRASCASGSCESSAGSVGVGFFASQAVVEVDGTKRQPKGGHGQCQSGAVWPTTETDGQRAVLEQAKALAGTGSLIPPHRRYIQQLRIYERQTANAGLSKMHGLRHAYAQRRYAELTGWPAPQAGGPSRTELTPVQQQVDRQARLVVSRELGHGRSQVTSVYLGR